MKSLKNIFLLLTASLLISMASSCRKMSENGDLDGQWQITRIEYADGTTTSPKGYYYCLFRSVVNLTSRTDKTESGNLICKDKKLFLSMPYSTTQELLPWGMNNTETTFDIKQLSGNKMTLQSDFALIEFRKF